MSEPKYTSIIRSDEPIRVEVHPGGYWFRVFCWVVESGTWARLNPSSRSVYVVLAKHCSGERWLAWPSIATIIRLAGVRRTQVYFAIAELEREGLLKRRNRGGGRQSTTYELLDVAETPSLPFPVRHEVPVRPTGPLPSGVVHPTRPAHRTRTRSIEQDSLNNNAVVVGELTKKGVETVAAVELVKRYGEAACRGALKMAKEQGRGLRNPGGFIRAALERGFAVPVKASETVDGYSEAVHRLRESQRESSERVAAAFYGSRMGTGSA
jgi:hypothetical protein